MRAKKRRGPGPSSTLLTPDRAGNVVGVDPHKRTLSATIVDPRGGILASEHFRVSGDGHRALEAWALGFGPIARPRAAPRSQAMARQGRAQRAAQRHP